VQPAAVHEHRGEERQPDGARAGRLDDRADGAIGKRDRDRAYEVDAGSLFLKEFTDALDPKVIKRIQHAEEPLPLEALAEVVNKNVEGAIAAQLNLVT